MDLFGETYFSAVQDVLQEPKRVLLKQHGIELPVKTDAPVRKLILTARILCMDDDDFYFLGIQMPADGPGDLISVRNESAALSLLIRRAKLLGEGFVETLNTDLYPYTDYMLQLARQSKTTMHTPATASIPNVQDQTADELCAWASATEPLIESRFCRKQDHGFEWRGCFVRPGKTIRPGDSVLEIMLDKVIDVRAALDDPTMGSVFKDVLAGTSKTEISDIDEDTVALLYSIADRAKGSEGRFYSYWRIMPSNLHTGLRLDLEAAQQMLEGTPLYDEVVSAQMHVRNRYHEMINGLAEAYPAVFDTQEVFTFDNYLWMVEIWYSYAMQLKYPGLAHRRAAIVPAADLMNHSPWAQVCRYGAVDEERNVIEYQSYLRVTEGDEVCLSYGNIPNSKAILFYGFSIPENPHDVYEFELGVDEADPNHVEKTEILERHDVNIREQKLRGPWSESASSPSSIPGPLLASVRILLASTPKEMEWLQNASKDELFSYMPDSKAAQDLPALTTLVQVLEHMQLPIQSALESTNEYVQQHGPHSAGGLADHIKVYLEAQVAIIESARERCKRRIVAIETVTRGELEMEPNDSQGE
eukprot:Clim_evm24s134 gene=Clim_evmTU24s134